MKKIKPGSNNGNPVRAVNAVDFAQHQSLQQVDNKKYGNFVRFSLDYIFGIFPGDIFEQLPRGPSRFLCS